MAWEPVYHTSSFAKCRLALRPADYPARQAAAPKPRGCHTAAHAQSDIKQGCQEPRLPLQKPTQLRALAPTVVLR